MKDIYFVQRNWKSDFLNPIAVSGSLSDDTKNMVAYEIGKEVEWLIRMPDPQTSINLRLAKIHALLDANKGDISRFDAFSSFRMAFFEYLLS